MEDNLLLIKNKDLSSVNSVGILDYYNLGLDVVSELTKINEITYYPSVISLIEAFEDGYVDSIMLANSVYELLYILIKSTNHKLTDLNFPIKPTIIYTDNFPQEKINIIDKAISYLTYDDINKMLLNNMSLITEVEKRRIFNSYLITIFLIMITLYIILSIIKKNKQKEIERAINYDALTGLYTQQKFITETRKMLNSNLNLKYAMFSFDVDNFKYINELYGFKVGDSILIKIGEFLREILNDHYPIARLSSDKFIFLVEDRGNVETGEIYSQTEELLDNKLKELIDNSHNIHYSVGCYIINDISIEISLMIDYCNLACSYSKEELGTAVTLYSDLMKQKEDIKNDIVYRMNNALKNREFILYYQPKFDLLTQEIVGAEALVRWFSDGKMMPPNDFIPLFEKNGFIEKLDYYVLDTACKFVAENKNTINIPTISINLSSITLMKTDIVEKIIAIVNKYSLENNCIELEVTESAFVDQFEVALEKIDNLRSKGFAISMDDFGTGVSSLGRLKNMDIDVLKIDREFVIETLVNKKSDVILENVIKMANQLDLETIAEGIETKEQLVFLRESGCNVGQGYYFARPLPEDEFLKLLTKD